MPLLSNARRMRRIYTVVPIVQRSLISRSYSSPHNARGCRNRKSRCKKQTVWDSEHVLDSQDITHSDMRTCTGWKLLVLQQGQLHVFIFTFCCYCWSVFSKSFHYDCQMDFELIGWYANCLIELITTRHKLNLLTMVI